MHTVRLQDVDRQMRAGFRLLRFAPAMEAVFRREFAAQRVRVVWIWALVGTLIYDAMFVGDSTMMADVLPGLMVARLAIFTPLAIGVILFLRRRPSPLAYDLMAILIAVAGAGLPLGVAIHTTGPYLFAYQSGNVAAMLFFVVALRPGFPAVIAGLGVMLTVQFVLTRLSGAFDPVIYSGIVSFYLTVALFLAISAYFTEYKERFTFLQMLRADLLQRELEQLSESDELTNLRNRRSLTIYRATHWAQDQNRTIGVLLFDIDRFKLFNDVYGHLEGDECIRRVAAEASDAVGRRGEAFRYGGEEFLVILPGADRESATQFGEALRARIEALAIPHRDRPDGNVVTISVGVAVGDPRQESLDSMLKRCDAALYAAKDAGRNTVQLSDDAVSTPLSPAERVLNRA